MLHFAAPLDIHTDLLLLYSVVSVGSDSTLVLWFDSRRMLLCADPTSDVFTEKNIDTNCITMVTFQGNIYYADLGGRVFKIIGPAEQCHILSS
jgi:hypothetical protein